jgi:hypothetical protein
MRAEVRSEEAHARDVVGGGQGVVHWKSHRRVRLDVNGLNVFALLVQGEERKYGSDKSELHDLCVHAGGAATGGGGGG